MGRAPGTRPPRQLELIRPTPSPIPTRLGWGSVVSQRGLPRHALTCLAGWTTWLPQGTILQDFVGLGWLDAVQLRRRVPLT